MYLIQYNKLKYLPSFWKLIFVPHYLLYWTSSDLHDDTIFKIVKALIFVCILFNVFFFFKIFMWSDQIGHHWLQFIIFKSLLRSYSGDYWVRVKRKKLCICHSIFFFFFSFSWLFLDRLAKIIFKALSSCCFECVWPLSELVIWYAMCFQPMLFRNKQ